MHQIINQMPVELVKRDYCPLLYYQRCGETDFDDNMRLHKSIQKEQYLQDLTFNPERPQFFVENETEYAKEAFRKGYRPEYGENLTKTKGFKNKVLNRLESLVLALFDKNKVVTKISEEGPNLQFIA